MEINGFKGKYVVANLFAQGVTFLIRVYTKELPRNHN